MSPSQESSPESLLAHAGWMRALALGLVRDPHEADDVVQDAALAVLLHPPPAEAALQPWLASVVRNFAWRRRRAATRRSEHEDRARRPASGDDVDVLERIDLQRKLLEAVRELPEPQRSTLVKRYFEGQTSADIARSQDVPAATVRARLKRGLDELRERLDREAGSRQAWMALILPLVPRELVPTAVGAGSGAVTASLVTQGALTMSIAKIALVTTAVLVSGLAWWNLTPARSGEASAALATPEPRSGPVELPAQPTPVVEVARQGERSAVDLAPPAVTPTPAQPVDAKAPAQTGRFDARVVDVRGAPWAGAELVLYLPRSRDSLALARGTTGADGRAEVELELPVFARTEAGDSAGSFVLLARRTGCATRRLELVVRSGELAHAGDIVLLEAGLLRGTVVDEHGVAIANARVGALPAEALAALDASDRDALARIGSDLFDRLLAHTSGADGGFEIEDVAAGSVVLWAHAEGRLYVLSEALQVEAAGVLEGLSIVLPPLTERDRVAGQVVGPDGRGRPASLMRDMRSARGRRVDYLDTDPSGHFEFPAAHLDSVYELMAHDGTRKFPPAGVRDVRVGDLQVVIALGQGSSLRVLVRDEQGAPVENARLRIDTPTTTYPASAAAAGLGEFNLEMPTGTFHIEASAPGFRAQQSARLDAAAPPAQVELLLVRAPRVRGQVTAEARPLAGAKVVAYSYDTEGSMTVNGLRCTVSPFTITEATTDAQGRFDLAVDSDGWIVLHVSATGWVDGESAPFDPEGPAADEEIELELGNGGAIEGRVLVPTGESAAGRIVGVHRGDGRPRSMRTAEDGTFRFDDLMAGDWYVLELDAEVPPHGGSYASYSGSDPMPFSCRVEVGRTTRFDIEAQ